MNINPRSDVIILKEVKPSGRTQAGLYIPETNEKDTISKGEIIAVGPGETNRAGQVVSHGFNVGDIVVFEGRRALPVTYEGEKYLFINAKEVFGTVSEEKLDA